MTQKREHFPNYPNLKKRGYTERWGWVELISVNKTSDGFLCGTGKTEHGELVSLFLGRANHA